MSAGNVAAGSVGDTLGPRSRSVRNPRCRWAERRAAPRANPLLRGQLAEFLDHGQVAVVPPCRAGPPFRWPRLAAWKEADRLRLRADWNGPGTTLFRSFARRVDLGACGSRRATARARLRVARPDVRPERASLSSTRPVAGTRRSRAQLADILAQFEDFATKLPHQFGQIRRLGGREGVDQHAIHHKNACNPDLPSRK